MTAEEHNKTLATLYFIYGAMHGLTLAGLLLLVLGVKLAGLELSGDCGAPVYDEATMQTSAPNIFVAGTAVAGTQDKYGVFIENCHVHVERIISALTGTSPPPVPAPIEQPES